MTAVAPVRVDVLEHRLATISVARGLDGTDLEDAAELVDDERRERLAGHVLGDDEQRLLGRHDLLEEGDELGDAVDLVLMDEDEGLLQHDLHRVGVGDEVGGEVAAVELHAFDDVDLGLPALALLDRDHAFLADLLEGLGHDLPDGRIVVSGDRGDRGDAAGDLIDGTGGGGDLLDDRGDAALEAADEGVRLDARGDLLQAGLEDRFGEDRGGGGAVAGVIAGLARGFADEPGTDVLDLVAKLDLLGDADAVLGDGGSTPALVDDGAAASRAEGALHRGGELLDT